MKILLLKLSTENGISETKKGFAANSWMESFNCGFSIKDTDTVDEIKILKSSPIVSQWIILCLVMHQSLNRTSHMSLGKVIIFIICLRQGRNCSDGCDLEITISESGSSKRASVSKYQEWVYAHQYAYFLSEMYFLTHQYELICQSWWTSKNGEYGTTFTLRIIFTYF